MDMKLWAPRRNLSDVADESGHFYLLMHWDSDVLFLFPIEIEQNRIAKCADCGDLSRKDPFGCHEPSQRRHDLVAGLEHDRVGALPIRLMQASVLHCCSSSRSIG